MAAAVTYGLRHPILCDGSVIVSFRQPPVDTTLRDNLGMNASIGGSMHSEVVISDNFFLGYQVAQVDKVYTSDSSC